MPSSKAVFANLQGELFWRSDIPDSHSRIPCLQALELPVTGITWAQNPESTVQQVIFTLTSMFI